MSRRSQQVTGIRTPGGRRTADWRTTAVLELLGRGKAPANQLVFRFGVQASTIEARRQEVLFAVEGPIRQRTSNWAEPLALEGKYADLAKAATQVVIRHERLDREFSSGPPRPGTTSR